MKMGALAAVAVAVILAGPAVSVGIAAEKPWQALKGVEATPMNSADMNVVTGKSIFSYLTSWGTSTTINKSTVYYWSNTSGTSIGVTGSFGSGTVTTK